MTIKITIDGETVHEIDARAYRKRIMHVDLRDTAKSLKQEHIDLPIIRDLDINIVFDSRADTDLHMLEEKARLDETDKDAQRYEESSNVTDEPEDEPDNVPDAPEQEENVNPVLNPPIDPEAEPVDDSVSEDVPEDSGTDDDSDDSEPSGDDESDDSDESSDDGPLDLG